jgi:hypothetical protein
LERAGQAIALGIIQGKSLITFRLFVNHVFVQTRRIAFKVINSPTLLLPQWHALLEREAPARFHGRSLPRDVSTRWNSTFNHLAAFVELGDYIDTFTGIREHGLRQFELTKEEWGCVKQLVKVLQVNPMLFFIYIELTFYRS